MWVVPEWPQDPILAQATWGNVPWRASGEDFSIPRKRVQERMASRLFLDVAISGLTPETDWGRRHWKGRRKGRKGPRFLKFSFALRGCNYEKRDVFSLLRPIWVGSVLQLATKSILTDTQRPMLAACGRQWSDLSLLKASGCALLQGPLRKLSSLSGTRRATRVTPLTFSVLGTRQILCQWTVCVRAFKFFLFLKYQAVLSFPPKSWFCLHISLSPATHISAIRPWHFMPICIHSLFLDIRVRHPPSARHWAGKGVQKWQDIYDVWIRNHITEKAAN